jgi:hypothetical protein
VDGRLGQLLPGSLEDGASTVNIGGKANSARMREGDIFRLVSDDDLLSGNPKAEITGLNSADRVITGITSQTVTVSPGFAAEPNSEIDHFFEYRVLRKSPFNNVTFGRTSQLAFTPRVYLNGDQLSPVITHPTGQVTVITDDFGTLKFTPLGNSRWKLEMAIVVDGSIDVVIPDGSNSVELGLTNMNVYQDIPIFTISDDGTRLGPWNIIHARIAERTVGSSYVGGNPPDVRLRRILVEADRERIPVATTSEFLVVLKNRDDLERINLDGALVTWEVRDSIRRAVKATGLATVVSAGLVRVEIPADALPEGVFSMELEVNLGGNPEFILRSNPMIVYVGG